MKLISIKPSTNKDKKLMATFERDNGRQVTTHFGSKGFKDFTIYSKQDPKVAKQHVLKMVSNQAINCLSGKQIPCEIDSVCVHGDGKSSVNTAKQIKLLQIK